MPIKKDPVAFEEPWRRNYEFYSLVLWGLGALGYLLWALFGTMPPGPSYWIAGVCVLMGLWQLPAAMRLKSLQKNLAGRPLTFMTIDELGKKTDSPKYKKLVWLGRGFEWTPGHTQRLYSMMTHDWSRVAEDSRTNTVTDWVHSLGDVLRNTHDAFAQNNAPTDHAIEEMGLKWIHGVEPQEIEIWQPIDHIKGHTLIVGTTGAGKTRFFDLLITQAIMRGETVFIIDPKGDAEMRDNAKAACAAVGRENDFVMFHPAFPDESTPINPLANFNAVTDIPSRIAALLPGSGSSESFKQFGWLAMNQICQALYFLDRRPTLKTIRSYLEMGGEDLLRQCMEKYGPACLGEAEFRAAYQATNQFDEEGKPKDRFWTPTKGYITVYRERLMADFPSVPIEGIISFCEHDKAHFGKMIASLIPILSMLTSGAVGELLSPVETTANTKGKVLTSKPFRDTRYFIEKKKVVYIGLNSLSDSVVGSALGSIILSDLASVAGNLYNFEEKKQGVNVFVDETSEVVNQPLTQLLNKGRGAGFRIFIATQLFADFAAKLGSKDEASQVLGNLNNVVALRTIEPQTQEFLTERMPKTRVSRVERAQSMSISSDEPLQHGGSLSERLVSEEAALFPAELFGCLPPLEFIAILSGGHVFKGRIPLLVKELPEEENK